jgi:predicted transcriptional regulator
MKVTNLNIRVDEETKIKLQELADDDCSNVSIIIRKAVKKYLEDNGK